MDIQKKDDYNPFEHRKIVKPISDIRALANLIKASLGSGLLAIPLAFANGGWGLSLICTVIVGFICTHCVHIFVKTSRVCCQAERQPQLGYSETCKAVFANGPKELRPYADLAGYLTEGLLFFTYTGVCCIFTVLIADSVKQLCDQYMPIEIISVHYYCMALLLPLCLMSQIRHLKWLGISSLTANILLFVTFAICIYYIFGKGISVTDKRIVGDFTRFPAFLSSVIFAMEGIGLVMHIENTMKKPEHFLGCPSVLVVAMILMTLLYCSLGLFGYLQYGDALRGSITLNLPIDDWPAICAKCCISLSVLFTYPLHFFVVIEIINKYTQPHIKEEYRKSADIIFRTIIVLTCGGIAIVLPLLEQIINIVGALFYSILGLIIPGIVETICKWNNLGKYNWILWKNILIVVFGFVSAISGCVVTIYDIVNILSGKVEYKI